MALLGALVGYPIDNQAHTSTNRPPRGDPRDDVLLNFNAVQCQEGYGQLVMGQDVRVEQDAVLFRMRNPKFICNVAGLGSRRPCIVYSFGSWNEISFEVGLETLAQQCEVHVFDPGKLPDQESQNRYNFTAHHYGVGARDTATQKTV